MARSARRLFVAAHAPLAAFEHTAKRLGGKIKRAVFTVVCCQNFAAATDRGGAIAIGCGSAGYPFQPRFERFKRGRLDARGRFPRCAGQRDHLIGIAGHAREQICLDIARGARNITRSATCAACDQAERD